MTLPARRHHARLANCHDEIAEDGAIVTLFLELGEDAPRDSTGIDTHEAPTIISGYRRA